MQKPASHRVEERFSLPLFLFTVGASLGGIVILLRLLAPDGVWQAQLTTQLGRLAVPFLLISMLNCFIEYIFHRYVLHKPVAPLLSRFYKQHTLHHTLTRIGRRRTPGGREVPFVENIYPVTTPEQGEASFFPWYTMLIFAAIVTPLLAVAQWLAPAFPWFFGGYAALAASLMLYELFHAVEHWAFERWAPLIEHRRFGWFWRKVYSFHLRHHAVIDCNEAISGFFTLPVADWLLGTLVLPKTLYVDGSEWQASEFTSPRPCALVRWCDEKTDAMVKNRRIRAQNTETDALPVHPLSRGEIIARYLTHGTGLAASVAAVVLLVTFAALRGDAQHILSVLVFGLSLVLLYHVGFVNFKQARARRTTSTRDRSHAAIFLFIAGTATPFLLESVGGAWGRTLFAVVWALCAIGAGARLLGSGRFHHIATMAYGALSLLALIALKPLLAALHPGAFWLLVGGGICYLCGVFHVWQRVRYAFVVRHVFALGGSACHLLAVLIFVLPAQG
ncbi:MAG: hemolysin III family protein [Opitutaceae bacterium]|nr:hemolysin III family protein [Opitutaceae bacterium]